MVVCVASDHAVIWTKPTDWEVALDNPKAKLFNENRETAITSWTDCHTRVLTKEIEPKVLREVLSHNGKESVNASDIK